MGNTHSEQDQQSKANPENKQESQSKQKKDTDIWSSFRNKTKASTVTQPSPFKPVPPNLFKGIPDFTSAGATSTFYSKQLLAEPKHEEERPLKSSLAMPAFLPQTTVTPNHAWVPKEPSAYNISWERPPINSPRSPPISSFVYPSVVENNPPKDPPKPVPQITRVLSPTRTVAPRGTDSSSCQRTSSRNPEETKPDPPASVKPVLAQTQAQAQEPDIKETPAPKKETSPKAPVPFLFTGTTPETTKGPSTSEVTMVDLKSSSAEKSEKSSSNCENAVVHNTVSKNDKVNVQTPVVISEETHAEIMTRLAYVEKKISLPEPPNNQSQAVLRQALNGGSYAEALKKAQPKINPIRREAKAKLLKKLSKSVAKLTETLVDASFEQGNFDPQQLSDSSSSIQTSPVAVIDQGTTSKKNVTAATKTTNSNQNERSAVSPNPIQREKEPPLASATKKIVQTTANVASKNTKPEPNNLTPNPPTLSHRNSSAKGTSPSQKAGISKTPFCQTHSAPTFDFTEEDILNAVKPGYFTESQLKAALKAAEVSSLGLFPETPKEIKQTSSEKTGKVEKKKVRESVKRVPIEVNSKPDAKEEPATDIPHECLDDSAVNAIHSELSNPTGTSKESQKPPIAPHRPARSSVSTDTSIKSSASPISAPPTNTLNAQTEEQGITAPKGTPTSPSKITDKAHKAQTKIPVQANQVQTKTKEVIHLPLKSNVAEKENTNTEKVLDTKPPPPSAHLPARPEGRWPPFTTDWSCAQKVRCQHRENGKLPNNVLQWLNVSQNYLCEPSWVTTASLAASIALSVRLDREDSRQ